MPVILHLIKKSVNFVIRKTSLPRNKITEVMLVLI